MTGATAGSARGTGSRVAIVVIPTQARAGSNAAFLVTFMGVRANQALELSMWVVNRPGGQADRKLGSVSGTATALPALGLPREFGIAIEGAPPSHSADECTATFCFPSTGSNQTASTPQTVERSFELPKGTPESSDGTGWELQLRLQHPSARSPVFHVQQGLRQLAPTSATYDWHDGHDVVFYHDSSADEGGTAGVYADVRKAIHDAQRLIFIADWSFHPLFRAPHNGPAGVAGSFGRLLLERASAGVPVAVHTWHHPPVGAPDSQNDQGAELLRMTATWAGQALPANLQWRASSHTGFGLSHHQKFVIVDVDAGDGRRKLKAFLGGLDLTKGRFDWPSHHILPDDPRAAGFRAITRFHGVDYDDWYNAEFGDDRTLPRQPWHDVHLQVLGPAVWDIVREFVGRWNVDPAIPGALGHTDSADVLAVFRSLFDDSRFVQQWEPHAGMFRAQVYRSMAQDHWGSNSIVETPAHRGDRSEFRWRLRQPHEASIQDAYVRGIRSAERFIYVETQYLIGSGAQWTDARETVANRIPQEIVTRTLQRIEEDVPFHTYVVVPMYPEGSPVGLGVVAQRQLEWRTMRYMVQAIFTRVGERWSDYISFYFLANWNTVSSPITTGDRKNRVRGNRRYMIYVHSKLMIVDDRYVIVGSANLNERSLAGDRDSEICVGLWPSSSEPARCVEQIRNTLRMPLWEEHLGSPASGAWHDPETSTCVAAVQARARSNYRNFRELRRSGSEGHLCLLPLTVDQTMFEIATTSHAPETDSFLPDSVFNPGFMAGLLSDTLLWTWKSPGWHAFQSESE